jgi:hypothetical protein
MSSSLQSWFRLLFTPAKSRRRRGRPARRSPHRLQLEKLETRDLLASYTPAQVYHAYGFDRVAFGDANHPQVAGNGAGQTIGIIDAYDDPAIASNLATFDNFYGIPAPPSFTKVNQDGGTNYPSPNMSWGSEIALDVEYAHAMAPAANILLVEANDSGDGSLETAVQYAANHGATVISMSFGHGEFFGETGHDHVYTHPGVTYFAGTGDSGAPGGYAAYSPNVVAVGGTSLYLDGSGNYSSESGWNGSGGGISAVESQPFYQAGVVTQSATRRCTPDLSFVADPSTGVWIYDTFGGVGDYPIGGTSAATPIAAALGAVVNQGRGYLFGRSNYDGIDYLDALYHLPQSDLNDITTGNNFGVFPGYFAGPGYDLVTGRGTPVVDRFVSGMIGAPVYNPLDGSLLVTGGGRGSTDVINLGVGNGQFNVGIQSSSPVAGASVPASQALHFNYNQTNTVTLCSGDGTTTLNVADSTSVTVNLQTHGNTTVNVGAGGNAVNAWEADPGTTTAVHGGPALTVGRNGTLAKIQGLVTLDNPPSYNTVVVDDSADTATHTLTLDNAPGFTTWGRITGLSSGVIEYKYADTASLTVKTGAGTQAVNVLATGKLGGDTTHRTTVQGGTGGMVFSVGNNSSLADVKGDLMLTTTAGYETVYVNDGNDGSDHNSVLLTATSLSGLSGGGAILFGGNDLAGLTINGGFGSNLYTIANTQASAVTGGNLTWLNTGTGVDLVQVRATTGALFINGQGGGGADVISLGNAGSLDGFYAPVYINDGPSYFTVNVYDTADGSGHQNVTLSSDALTGLTRPAAPIYFGPLSLKALNVNAGDGDNLFTVTSLQAYQLTTLNTGNGHDTVTVKAAPKPLNVNEGGTGLDVVNLGDAGTLGGILAPVTINNGPSYSTVNVNDGSDNSTHNQVYLSAGALTGLTTGAAPIYFGLASVKVLNVYVGNGGNTYNVTGTPADESTILNSGLGADTFNVYATGYPLTVNGHGYDVVNLGGAGTLGNITAQVTITNSYAYDTVYVDDSADGNSHPNVSLSATALTGLTPPSAPINFGPGVSTLTITGGPNVSTYNVTGSEAFDGTILNTAGIAIVNVKAIANALTINDGGFGFDTINLGNAGSLAGITGPVSINSSNFVHVSADDSADGGAHPNVTLSATALTGLTPPSAPITFGAHCVSVLVITGGTGTSAYTVTGLQAFGGTTLNTGGGTATVTVVAAPTALIVAGGPAGATTLVGANPGNVWQLSGASPNAGTLSGPAYASPVNFSNVQNLTAGVGGDHFNFAAGASITGSLSGAANSTLDYTAYTTSVVVDLQLPAPGTDTGVGGTVSGIGTVIGGSGAPGTAGLYNLLIGSGGNTLKGGTGRRNLLVAGGTPSTLVGGDGDDLLIAGSTAYDGTAAGLASWQLIAAYWAGPDSFQNRANNLQAAAGVPRLDHTTVTGNGAGNTLTGNGGRLLLYSTGQDTPSGFGTTLTVQIN